MSALAAATLTAKARISFAKAHSIAKANQPTRSPKTIIAAGKRTDRRLVSRVYP